MRYARCKHGVNIEIPTYCAACEREDDARKAAHVHDWFEDGEYAVCRKCGQSTVRFPIQITMYEVIHEWLRENNPAALDLCPFKVVRHV